MFQVLRPLLKPLDVVLHSLLPAQKEACLPSFPPTDSNLEHRLLLILVSKHLTIAPLQGHLFSL